MPAAKNGAQASDPAFRSGGEEGLELATKGVLIGVCPAHAALVSVLSCISSLAAASSCGRDSQAREHG